MSYLRRFLGFWSDFLVGDRPELFVGPIVALAAAWMLVRAGLPGVLTGSALFVLVAGVGAVSVLLAGRK